MNKFYRTVCVLLQYGKKNNKNNSTSSFKTKIKKR